MSINKITYAGHSAVLLRSDSINIAIDPWLEGNPLCPPDLKNPDPFDLICLTHGHADHASDVMRLVKDASSKGKKTSVAATYELAMILVNEGLPQDQVQPMNKGGSIEFGKIKISLTNAFHSSSYDTASGSIYAGEACGLILQDQENCFYHAGDTALFSDMQLIRDFYKPKIAFIPIGDRFTMGPKEAKMALKLLRPEIAIPIHHKTFPLLTGTAEELIAHCKSDKETENIKIIELEPGQDLNL